MEEPPKPPPAEDLKTVQVSVLIANALDSAAAHTSFGRLALADEKSAPMYGFGTATRKQAEKVYLSEELSMGIGKVSPGPKYTVQDNLNFPQPAQSSFPRDPRASLGPKRAYDYFEIRDTVSDPVKSKHFVQKDYGSTKFGTGSRAQQTTQSVSPGPQYMPPHRMDRPSSQKYSLGARRTNKGASSLVNQVSTPGLVGPGRYAPEKAGFTSIHQSIKEWSFSKRQRTTVEPHSTSKHQTYDNASSCGPQVRSGRKTAPTIGFGSATREQGKRAGMFKDAMATRPVTVRIQHPSNY